MANQKVTLEGLQEVSGQLSQLLSDALRADILHSVVDAAKIAEESVLAGTPEGPTGNLKKGIQSYGLKLRPRKDITAVVGVDYGVAPHVLLLEYGTAARFNIYSDKKQKKKLKTKRFTGKGPETQFFSKGVKRARGAIGAIIERGVGKAIDKALTRG